MFERLRKGPENNTQSIDNAPNLNIQFGVMMQNCIP